jgi:hypothetical protein
MHGLPVLAAVRAAVHAAVAIKALSRLLQDFELRSPRVQ